MACLVLGAVQRPANRRAAGNRSNSFLAQEPCANMELTANVPVTAPCASCNQRVRFLRVATAGMLPDHLIPGQPDLCRSQTNSLAVAQVNCARSTRHFNGGFDARSRHDGADAYSDAWCNTSRLQYLLAV